MPSYSCRFQAHRIYPGFFPGRVTYNTIKRWNQVERVLTAGSLPLRRMSPDQQQAALRYSVCRVVEDINTRTELLASPHVYVPDALLGISMRITRRRVQEPKETFRLDFLIRPGGVPQLVFTTESDPCEIFYDFILRCAVAYSRYDINDELGNKLRMGDVGAYALMKRAFHADAANAFLDAATEAGTGEKINLTGRS